MTNALILSGGGARAAYQVGVLSAINDLLPSTTRNPFPIICGTSAGAINALALASHTGHFYEAVDDLNKIWTNLSTDKVFKTSWRDLMCGGGRLFMSLFNEGMSKKRSLALLDNEPLRAFLKDYIDFDQLDVGLQRGDLKAVCTTAMNYSTGESVSFFQGDKTVEGWRRYRRTGEPAKLTLDHLMASAAIPGIFPAVKLGLDYFGDGALRQVAPISPALHMGADRIFVIGVSNNRDPLSRTKQVPRTKHSPSIAQVFGQLFNSAFIDGLEGDLEHLERVNALLKLIPDEVMEEQKTQLRPVDTIVISPSKALDKLAGRKIRHMPRSVRMFLRSAGATNKGGGAATTSYLLFEKPYLDELMELGYQDAMWEKDNIQAFFEV
ncbi:patatin-like phospholipase family protein [Aestuariicella hydrocarbonica]|uniref:Patatin-like phospholipase family protein n=1 Tax=Pseudomaricurvus hydrocarbonicus TaxID=1470433 RepID=A0A9E5JTU1_9GAMM|nr:patatin-like phospholipase family protein [Aestuariicella hydrocarbonica]NHO65458.1 patatin-like phospholipase family protein [Aestuariicella hydrocarbonica]